METTCEQHTLRNSRRNIRYMAFLVAAMAPDMAHALDLAWRDATPFPEKTTVLALKSTYATSDQLRLDNRAAITQGTSLYTNIETLEINRYETLFGQPCQYGIWVPRIQTGGKVLGRDLSGASGMADPYLEIAFWPVHRPDWGTEVVVANFVSLPVGAYQPQRTHNPGGNRWTDDVVVSLLQEIAPGLKLELVADATMYGANRDANAAHQTLTQTPTYRSQIWLSQNLTDIFILATGYNELWGGKNKLNGTNNGFKSDEKQIRLGAQYNISNDIILQLSAYHDIDRDGGYPWRQVYQMLTILKL